LAEFAFDGDALQVFLPALFFVVFELLAVGFGFLARLITIYSQLSSL
jgi:hypothetical protein